MSIELQKNDGILEQIGRLIEAIDSDESKPSFQVRQDLLNYLNGMLKYAALPEIDPTDPVETTLVKYFLVAAKRSPVDQSIEKWRVYAEGYATADRVAAIATCLNAYLQEMRKYFGVSETTALATTNRPNNLEELGERLVYAINGLINSPGVEFVQIAPPAQGIRNDQFYLRQRIEKGTKIFPLDRIEGWISTLKVVCCLPGNPVISTGYVSVSGHRESCLIIQTPRETWEPIAFNERSLQALFGSKWKGEYTNPIVLKPGIALDNSPIQFELDGHLLIGAATRGGKTTLLNNLVFQLVYQYPPHCCQLLIWDATETELREYSGIPSCWGGKVFSKVPDILRSLDYLKAEIERRKKTVVEADCYSTLDFNRKKIALNSPNAELLPAIILVADEVDQLTEDIEDYGIENSPEDEPKKRKVDGANLRADFTKVIHSLFRGGAKWGVHVIGASQRPSKEAGSIWAGHGKSNITTRICLRTDADTSRIVLGTSTLGSSLAGNGDALIVSPTHDEPTRFQSFYVDPRGFVAPALGKLKGKTFNPNTGKFGVYSEGDLISYPLYPRRFNVSPKAEEIDLFSSGEEDYITEAIQLYCEQSAALGKIVTANELVSHLRALDLIEGNEQTVRLEVEKRRKLWGAAY